MISVLSDFDQEILIMDMVIFELHINNVKNMWLPI